MGAPGEEILADIECWPLPCLVTNRAPQEGGDFLGEEHERFDWLRRADAAGAAYIDVEYAQFEAFGRKPQRAKLILSHHDFRGMGGDLNRIIAGMYRAGADIAKVAVTPHLLPTSNTIADLGEQWGRFSDHWLDKEHKGLIAIAMGEIGLASRVLAGAWGLDGTFGIISGGTESAPGQPTIHELRERFRVHQQGEETRIFGIIGNPVGHSLSPVIHNAAFNECRIDAVYVPFLVEDPASFWWSCGDWIDGFSVTIPHKSSVIGLVDEIEDLAQDIGAINTIYRNEAERVIGANTDAPATVNCVQLQASTVAGKIVLLLGAGGVGRAVAFAMKQAGADVIIANRTVETAHKLANEVGCSACSLSEALDLEYDILVNGTSIGMGTDESPWPADRHRPESVVFDTVYTPLETRLLQDAAEHQCQCVCGLNMLIDQALGQFERWTGRVAPVQLMQRMALEHLGMDWPEHLTCQGLEDSSASRSSLPSAAIKRSATELIQ